MTRLGLFEGFGIELEYMLVDPDTLNIRPAADRVLARLAGKAAADFSCDGVTWSNELAAHVIELKVSEPASDLRHLSARLGRAVAEIQPTLESLDLRLLPTGMHPWMEPETETRLWPHENAEIYEAYHRIFNCHRHGWANVQSTHLNLPFADDDQFGRLHAAVRLILPLLPALAASSPIAEEALTGDLDHRLRHYLHHCDPVPSLVGDVIPEPIFDQATYQRQILEPIVADVAHLDVDDVLRIDFLNARGAIARFDRGSIEIRLLDVQERPAADVSICAAIVAVLRQITDERWSTAQCQRDVPTRTLRKLLNAAIRSGESAIFDDSEFLRQFGLPPGRPTAGRLWRKLLEPLRQQDPVLDTLFAPLDIVLDQGTLATRIRRSLGDSFSPNRLSQVYHQLSDCLREDKHFPI